ncbi:MAG: helix-turn-helix domain-containing protein [Richelia sp. RM2_1_2]|nr:helix-turn-helix domain-containing protein [Richelia sp. SM2_1_7]NJM19233.1 helix-turn-helix domain-containing protein [Richelia sp. SM1_7_0]NJN11559.1 helix-turn-helix domain-containing protein [Richelia sp. RM1_1_1]NJO26989.1 helix-turn-helix domain-containing protein [Richelia sp. SL_2_1]NJO62298.1 helix-turn-helix domain-containing protein [Richelia sp. RM2_1_2]
MSTIHDPRYIQLIKQLINARSQRGITQIVLAQKLGQHQSYIAKIEGRLKSTLSGKRIFVCSLKPTEDVFPSKIIAAWQKYRNGLQIKT